MASWDVVWPDSLLYERSKRSNFVKFFRLEGISPLIELLERSKVTRFLIFPISGGMDPLI